MYWWIIGHNKEETSADVPPEQSFAPSIIRHNIEIGPSPQIELEIKMANAGQTDLVSSMYDPSNSWHILTAGVIQGTFWKEQLWNKMVIL